MMARTDTLFYNIVNIIYTLLCYSLVLTKTIGQGFAAAGNLPTTNPTVPANYSVRLTDGSIPLEGKVEIYFEQSWHTVCGTNWDIAEALTVCRQLGLGSAVEGGLWSSLTESTPTPAAESVEESKSEKDRLGILRVDCSDSTSSIANCSVVRISDNECNHTDDAGVVCSETSKNDYKLRVADGTQACNGRVEILYQGVWGGVCRTSWRQNTASGQVACRQAGCGDLVTPDANFGVFPEYQPIYLFHVNCDGSEERLVDCFHAGWQLGDCHDSEAAAVACHPPDASPSPETYEVRLVGGASNHSGRVEIFYNGEWGSVCDDGWDLRDANVTCRQLGFYSAIKHTTRSHFKPGTGAHILSWVECKGTEPRLADCPHPAWYSGLCSHEYGEAGVICQATSDLDTLDVRLVGGKSPNEGNVEVFFNGEWGPICHDGWDFEDADIACRQLGFGMALKAYRNSHFGHGNGTAILSDIRCTGQESSLAECGHSGWYERADCYVMLNTAGVVCSPKATVSTPEPTAAVPSSIVGVNHTSGILDSGELGTTIEPLDVTTTVETKIEPVKLKPDHQYTVRLRDGATDFEGRVEVFHGNTWGTVCGYGWDIHDAIVVCRQLGLGVAVEAKSNAEYGMGNGPILLANLECSGSENTLQNCTSWDWYNIGEGYCNHSSDAGVVCSKASTLDYEIRLIGGTSTCNGRVELLYRGSWGGVCSQQWDAADAQVLCRQLGCGPPTSAFADFGRSSGPIYLSELNCKGTENALIDCGHSGWENANCDGIPHAGLVCNAMNQTNPDIPLLPNDESNQGQIEASSAAIKVKPATPLSVTAAASPSSESAEDYVLCEGGPYSKRHHRRTSTIGIILGTLFLVGITFIAGAMLISFVRRKRVGDYSPGLPLSSYVKMDNHESSEHGLP